jgi:aryl-alcohol dehydrogenase-like predicted oxidoreductase
VKQYRDARGERALAVIEAIASAYQVPIAAIALAWLMAQPTVTAPIASARTVDQLRDLLPAAMLRLRNEDVARLNALT